MEFSVSRRGAAVISLWFVLVGAAVSLPFWKNYFVNTFLFFFAYSALCLCLLTLHFASCTVRVGAHHITVRRGVLFLRTRRLPLRFVAGCHVLRSPLQRLTGTCCISLYAAGSFTFVAGAPFAKAEQLATLLTQGRHTL